MTGKEYIHINFYLPVERALCAFEFVYFARPDSNIDGINVMEARRNMGRELAKESPVDVDIVIPVPDSGIAGALGYAEARNIFYDMGLMKNRYIGRTFIGPQQKDRDLAVHLKLNPVKRLIEGKKVGIVDGFDSQRNYKQADCPTTTRKRSQRGAYVDYFTSGYCSLLLWDRYFREGSTYCRTEIIR